MPSYLREPSGSVCWNCDRRADETVRITLRMPTGDESTLRLCGGCYDAVYIPLAAEAEGAGIAIGRGLTLLVLTRVGDRSAPA